MFLISCAPHLEIPGPATAMSNRDYCAIYRLYNVFENLQCHRETLHYLKETLHYIREPLQYIDVALQHRKDTTSS